MPGLLDATCVFDPANFAHSTHDPEGGTFDWSAFQSVRLPLEGASEFGDRFEPDECTCATTPDDALHVFGQQRGSPGVLAYTTSRVRDGRQRIWDVPWRFTQSASDPDIRPVDHIACAAAPNGDIHLLAVTQTGAVYRTVLFANGTWQPTWLGDFPPPDIRPIADVACSASSTGDLYVCALTREGTLYYAIFRNGNWQGWLADFPPPDIRPLGQTTLFDRPVACTVTPSGDLHLCVVTQAGGLFHTIRFAGGDWAPNWDDVLQATRVLPPIEGSGGTVTCASDQGGNLHLCVVTRSSDQQNGGQLWYAQRNRVDGSWAGFTHVQFGVGRMLSLGVSWSLPVL
jgi:hypothetical protein